jgi:hypothetical protein
MDTISLKFQLSANGTGTCFSLRVDGQTVWQGDPGTADHLIEYNELPDTDGEHHQIEFVLEDKTFDHTTLDEQGIIVNDLLITISDIYIDNVLMDQKIHNIARYKHNFNGSGEQTECQFSGVMGCNGAVAFECTSPFYIWLLENL